MAITTPEPAAITGRAAVPGPANPAQPGAGRLVGRAAVPAPARSGAGHQGYEPGRSSGGGYGGGPPGGRPAALVARRRPRRRKVLLAVALSVLLLVLVGAGGLWLYTRSLNNNLGRIDAFSAISSADRPAEGASGTLNVLILGSDSRDPDAVETGGTYRVDTVMLMHVPSGQDQAYLISIPRDLWVFVPPSPDGSAGGHDAKINAAIAFGGVPLMVQTVESYTGVRIDHVMLLDFAGFVEVTDALGGVDLHIDQTIESIHGDHRVFEAGDQHLSGAEALDYIRQRKQFADGDFSRIRNQQQFLKALMDQAVSTGTLTNPGRLNAFLQTVTSTLTVDEEFSLAGVGWQLRNLRSSNLTFLTSPHAGTGSAGGQSVVFSDDEAAAALFEAIRQDRMAQWAADHPDREGE
jgi:LCP family protein required for cell wall assembly